LAFIGLPSPAQILAQVVGLSVRDIQWQIAPEWLRDSSVVTMESLSETTIRSLTPYDLSFPPKWGAKCTPTGPATRRVLPPGEIEDIDRISFLLHTSNVVFCQITLALGLDGLKAVPAEHQTDSSIDYCRD